MFTLPEMLGKLSREEKKTIVEILLANYRQWFQLDNNRNDRLLAVMVWLMYDDMLSYFDKQILENAKENLDIVYIADDIIAFAERFIIK